MGLLEGEDTVGGNPANRGRMGRGRPQEVETELAGSAVRWGTAE